MYTIKNQITPIKGDVCIPGDKSISHRSIMFSALADGTSEITGFLKSEDCLATISCFRQMGVTIDETINSLINVPTITVHGKGLNALKAPRKELYTGNSGTTTRLISGILAAQKFRSKLTGDSSIEERPMGRIIKPLTLMGADIKSEKGNDCCPLIINGKQLHGISYHSPVASAQVKSCIILAGLYASTETDVYEPSLSRNHTEIMLRAFGADISNYTDIDGGASASLHPGTPLHSMKINVPGDISSAAYFIAAAILIPGSEVLIHNVGINPTRAGIISVLKQMGADITFYNEDNSLEPKADVLVKHSLLHGNNNGSFEIGGVSIPTLIDEIPIIAVLAATADCTTIIRDAAELKVKESDRIQVVTDNLLKMGCDVTPTDDGMIIRGGRPLHGAEIDSHNDHRIAMSFAIAGLIADGETVIKDSDCVNISYPSFFRDLNTLIGKNNS